MFFFINYHVLMVLHCLFIIILVRLFTLYSKMRNILPVNRMSPFIQNSRTNKSHVLKHQKKIQTKQYWHALQRRVWQYRQVLPHTINKNRDCFTALLFANRKVAIEAHALRINDTLDFFHDHLSLWWSPRAFYNIWRIQKAQKFHCFRVATPAYARVTWRC